MNSSPKPAIADTTMSDTIKKIEGIAHDNAENNMAQDGYTKFVHKNSILPAHNPHYCRPALLLVSTDDTVPEHYTREDMEQCFAAGSLNAGARNKHEFAEAFDEWLKGRQARNNHLDPRP